MVGDLNKIATSVLNSTPSYKEQRRLQYYKKALYSSLHGTHTSVKKVKELQIMSTIYEADVEVELAERFGPQVGISDITSSFNAIDFIVNHLGIKCSDDIARELEGLVSLFVTVTNSSNLIGALAGIVLYVRQRYSTSLTLEILKVIQDTFGMLPQSGSDTTTPEPDWLVFMKDIRQNWKQAQGSPLFANFSRILSLLVVSGLFSVSDLTFSVNGFKLIEPNCKTMCGSATDILTAVSDITVFFCERVYHSLKTRSLTPFFYSDMETVDLEKDFATMEAHWDLFFNGNLEKIAGKSPQDFLVNVANMQDRIQGMMLTCKGLDKRLLESKYRRCLEISNGATLMRANSSFRPSPYSIEYYGRSSVGKSTISAQTSRILLSSAGLDTSDNVKYNHVSGRKHWDGCRSDVVEIKIDDHANTKAEFVEKSPCDDIIRICNNIPFAPPMADLANKGKVFIEPDLFTLTTNVEDLDARVYSNNPTSIQRRMHVIVEVEVKPEFQKIVGGQCAGLDTQKALAANTVDGVYTPALYDDVWLVTVKEVVPAVKETVAATYQVVTHEGRKLEKVGMATWLAFATEQFHMHRDQQADIGKASATKVEVQKCPVEGCIHIRECCPHHGNTPQLGLDDVKTTFTQTTESLFTEAQEFFQTWDWLPYLPEGVVRNNLFVNVMCVLNRGQLSEIYKQYTRYNVIATIALQALLLLSFPQVDVAALTCFVLISAIVCQLLLIIQVRTEYYNRLVMRNTLNLVQKRWRDSMGKALVAASATLGTLYAISKIYKHLYGHFAQGSLEPTSIEDIAARDAEPNVWASVSKRPLPCTQKSIEHTVEVVDSKVQKNLLYATFEGSDGAKRMGNVLFVDSNMLLAPNHYFTESKGESIKLTCYKENASSIGGSFVTRIDLVSSYLIPGTDMRVCYSPSGGSFGNLLEYFPTGKISDHAFHLMWRAKDGKRTTAQGYARVKDTNNGVAHFFGGEYLNLTINTFRGMCGAVLISDNKQTCITGLHLGGKEGTTRGCFGTFTKQEIETGIEEVRKVPGVLKTGTEGDFTPQVLGKSILTHGELHPKSPVNYLPEGSQFSWYGTCTGMVTSISAVRKTPISDKIKEVTGQENIWGKPKMRPEYEAWQKAMANASHPAEPVEHAILMQSVEDYSEPLLALAKQEPWCLEKPLSDQENLCGRPGEKFIDAIPLNTAIGYPQTGAKRNFIITHEPTPERPNNIEFEPEVMEEIRKCEDNYKKGLRNHVVAKACKKDEILPTASEKCRIIYANPIQLTWLSRKYFLPVARFLQMNPLLSECAVGINCHGPEWQQLHEFVFQHGEDQLIGGDYGKYDQKLPSQKLNASLNIMISIAKCMDYSDEDIRVMEAMAGDIVYALIAYNGDLLGVQSGTHISGNSLTVLLNGISGSLNLRDFFYTKYGKEVKFRDAVALVTYGDDNIGSVAKGFEEFNIKGASEFLAKFGQIYTMPDKTSKLRPYLDKDEFEFLKRTSVYHPKLGCNIGALLEKSIFKSLHCYMRPKNAPLTPNEACAQNIDTALREWFNHGEDLYELRRAQMKEVAEDGGLTHMCVMLNASYDDVVEDWKYKYAGGPKPEREVVPFEIQSCEQQGW